MNDEKGNTPMAQAPRGFAAEPYDGAGELVWTADYYGGNITFQTVDPEGTFKGVAVAVPSSLVSAIAAQLAFGGQEALDVKDEAEAAAAAERTRLLVSEALDGIK